MKENKELACGTRLEYNDKAIKIKGRLSFLKVTIKLSAEEIANQLTYAEIIKILNAHDSIMKNLAISDSKGRRIEP